MVTMFQKCPRWLAFALLLLAGACQAQTALHWSEYKMADGLSEPAFHAISFTAQGRLLASATNVPLASRLDGYSVSNFPAPPGGFGRIAESPGGQRWAMNASGLLEFTHGSWQLHSNQEIASALAVESGSSGNAPSFLPIRQGSVLFLLPQSLQEFSEENLDGPRTFVLRQASQSQIGRFTGMTVARDGELWISGERGVARLVGPVRNVGANTEWQAFPSPPSLADAVLGRPTADENHGIILLAKNAGGHQTDVVWFDGQNWKITPAAGRNFLSAWRGPEHLLWAATSERLFSCAPPETNWVENQDIAAGQINDVALEPGGAFWLATAVGLFRGASPLWWKSAAALDGSPAAAAAHPKPAAAWANQPNQASAAEAPTNIIISIDLPGGDLLCATLDQLWEYSGRQWKLLNYRFNHINALAAGRDGHLWLASNGGLFRSYEGAWLDNGPAEGLPEGPVCSVIENAAGQLLAATTRGVYEFHPEADPDPPRLAVRTLAGLGMRLREGESLGLVFEGRDKWNYTPVTRLLYSYQFDQEGWSAFRELAAVTVPPPAAGRHFFQVRAMNRNGRMEIPSTTLELTVLTPWFRELRLWAALVLGAGAALFFAGLAWHRHRLLVRSHAAIEQAVAERTRELEIATRELMLSQKMTALGTLAAGIAHDFNNILSIIKGSVQIIEDNPGQSEKIRTRLARIKTVVQQGAEIVDAMLGFSRPPGSPPGPCDVNAVVEETLRLLGDRFLRETEVEFSRGADLPPCAVPKEFIQQILINFIFNAAEAMAARKKITLTTRRADVMPANLVLTPAAADAFILIAVRDEGAGMTPEIQARIFEPFFTTKTLSARRGTGLGLSMVYELAKKVGAGLAVQSQGRALNIYAVLRVKKVGAGLAVQSQPGAGSEFTLILPPSQAAAPPATPTA